MKIDSALWTIENRQAKMFAATSCGPGLTVTFIKMKILSSNLSIILLMTLLIPLAYVNCEQNKNCEQPFLSSRYIPFEFDILI